MTLVGCLTIGLEDLGEVLSDRVRHHVFVELGAEYLLVRLVDLDDFLDAPANVAREERLD